MTDAVAAVHQADIAKIVAVGAGVLAVGELLFTGSGLLRQGEAHHA